MALPHADTRLMSPAGLSRRLPRRERTALRVHGGAATALSSCVGDCDGDARVTIDELLRGVAMALGDQPANACPAFGAPVSIARLVDAVDNALSGCAECGDGDVTGSEQCDDGNSTGGDGCPYTSYGADCLPCTADDEPASGGERQIAFTTAQAGELVGTPFDCDLLAGDPDAGIVLGVLVATTDVAGGTASFVVACR